MARWWSSLTGGLAVVTVLAGTGAAQNKDALTKDVLDLNTATREQLVAFPGIGQAYADKIIAARPFKMRSELVSRNIMPASEYLEIKAGLAPTAEDAAAVKAAEKPRALGPLRDGMGRLNLNTASRDDLAGVKGIGQAYADKIIEARPYRSAEELIKRNVVPLNVYQAIRNSVFAQ